MKFKISNSRKFGRSNSWWKMIIFELILCLVFANVITGMTTKGNTDEYATQTSRDENTKSSVNDVKHPVENTSISNLITSIMNFGKTLSQLLAPYFNFNIPGFDFDMNSMENGIATFRSALARVDPASTGSAGMMAVGVGAVAGPYIIDIIKSVVSVVIGFFDNLYYVATGEALSRRTIPDEVWEQLFHVTIEHIAQD